jgi:hypothetical protein
MIERIPPTLFPSPQSHPARHAAQLDRPANARASAPTPASVDAVLSLPGRPLDDPARGSLERRFGHDFSMVRIHTDARAAESAADVEAQAYARGIDIVFGHGRYAPGTSAGKRLLAHELAHVIQQRNGAAHSGTVANDSAVEADADRIGQAAVDSNAPLRVQEMSARAIARQPETDEEKNRRRLAERDRPNTNAPASASPVTAPKIETLTTNDDEIQVLVDGYTLATIQFPKGADKSFRIDSTWAADNHRAVTIAVPAGAVVNDHNPLGDGPHRFIYLRVVPFAVPGTKAPGKKAPQAPVVKPAASPSPSGSAVQDLLTNPYAEQLSEERAKQVRAYLSRYTFNKSEKILKVFKGCSPEEFQDLQDKLGADMDKIFDDLDPFSAVQLGALGPVEYGIETLNQKRAKYIVDTVSDFGTAPAAILIHRMLSRMYTNDIKSVLGILAADRHLHDTIMETEMSLVRRYLVTRGIDLSMYQDRSFGFTDVFRPIGHFFSRTIWEKTIWADAIYGDLAGQIGKLPTKEEQEAAWAAYYGQYYNEETLSTKALAYDVADYVTLGIPLSFVQAGKGAVTGTQKIVSGEPEKGIEQLLPAIIIILTSFGAKVKMKGAAQPKARPKASAPEPKVAGPTQAAPEGMIGPEGTGRFTLPEYSGPASPEAARVGALLGLGAETQAAAGVLIERLGPDGVRKAAGYIQNDSAAARLVVKGGMPSLEALVDAEGNVEQAKKNLASGKAPPQLPPAPEAAKAAPAFASSLGELNEGKVARKYHPNSMLLPEKAGGADLLDLSESGSKTEEITYETVPGRKTKTGGKTQPRSIVAVNSHVKGGRWISVKTVFAASAKNVKARVGEAFAKFRNAWRPTAPKPRFEFEPMEANIHWRVILDGKPDSITIHLDLESATITDEITSAAEDAVRAQDLGDMPSGELMITDNKGGAYRRSFVEIKGGAETK